MNSKPDVPPMTTLLPESARRHSADHGDSLAVIEGGLRWTWRDLDARADGVALALARGGIGPATRVALLAPAGASAIAFLHGAGRAGAVVAPLNHRLANAELRPYLADLDVAVVVAPEDLAARAAGLGRPVLSLERLVGVRSEGGGERLDDAFNTAEISAAAPALIVATSGTTGRPKGAILTHGQLVASAAAWNEFLPPATGWLASLSFAHVGGLGIVYRAALAGAPVVMAAAEDRAAQLAAMSEPPVSHISVVAVQLGRLLEVSPKPPPGLRAVLLGGGPLPPELIRRALSLGWPVVPTYGMTESASGITAMSTVDAGARLGSAGRALPGVELRIREPAGDGVGDIEVRGPSVFAGYFGRPDETAAVLAADGWYRTGDLGSVDADGYLSVADRRLDLLVSGGENVYPAEIEAVLAGHPAVADAGVVPRPDSRWGAVPVAAVVIRTGATDTDDQLAAYCRERLARFKVPATIVRLPSIPRFASGKLNRRALLDLLSAGWVGRPTEKVAVPAALHLTRPDGARIAYRLLGPRRVGATDASVPADFPTVLMLHATLSSGWQLKQLARLVGRWATVVLPDRRGSGASRLANPRPVELAEQVADAVALLDEVGVARATVFGHSFGAVVALALAAAYPERVRAVVAYEPPLLDMLGPVDGNGREVLARRVVSAHAHGGAPAAAEEFLSAIGAATMLSTAWPATKAALLAAGDGALADIGSMGSASVDLALVRCHVALVTGDASAPFYAEIADAVARVLPLASRVSLPQLRHEAPITQPAAVAELLHDAVLGRPPSPELA
jgi:o-succinylbenzoate---CoA ligase